MMPSTNETMVIDGGLATELEARGCDISGALWSARVLREAPDAIEQLHYDYFAAGARVAITASYQASYEGFAAIGLDAGETTRLLRLSVELARSARARCQRDRPQDRRELFVAASVGPFGATTHDGAEYRGDYGLTSGQLVAFHERRFAVLAASGADFLACETIPVLEEARAYATLLARHRDVQAWLSFTSPDGAHTSHGESLVDCARLADGLPSVFAVGVNCVKPEVVGRAIRALRSGTGKPIVVYPNSGERWDAGSECWHGAPGQEGLAALAPDWIAAGAGFIGGCCRTGPAEIASLARAVARAGIRAAGAPDLAAIRALLERCRLPTDDLDRARPWFVAAYAGASLVGTGALEVLGTTGFLRSVAVAEQARGTGLGSALVQAVEDEARRRGLEELALLTETARDYFARLGYAEIPREQAPEELQSTAQFRSLCTQSAHCMVKRLTPVRMATR
jgi:homocysteine S-methyltransferase